MENRIINYAKKSYLDELLASEIYRRLAESIGDESIRNKLIKASEMERGHAEFWRRFLVKRDVKLSGHRINRWKFYLIKILYMFLGIGLVLRILERDEKEAVETYSYILDNADLDEEEREGIKNIIEDELLHEEEFLEEESRFKEFFKSHGVRVEVVLGEEPRSLQQELAEDLIAIVTSFADRLYGMRSHKRKKVVESAKQAIRDC